MVQIRKRKKEEFLHPHRRVLSDIEAESQKIRDLRKRKEQIDYDRLRLTKNLERIEKGDFKNIQRDITDLLKEAQAQKIKQQAVSLQPSDLKSLKTMIHQGTERVKLLRVIFSCLQEGIIDFYREIEKNF